MARKRLKAGKVFFYLMVVMYTGLGLLHLVRPEAYLFVMPAWLPRKLELIYISGVAEILLGLGLLPEATRKVSAWLIIAMLVVYLALIHLPMAVDYADKNTWLYVVILLRIPLQFVLIRWAWLYTRNRGQRPVTTAAPGRH